MTKYGNPKWENQKVRSGRFALNNWPTLWVGPFAKNRHKKPPLVAQVGCLRKPHGPPLLGDKLYGDKLCMNLETNYLEINACPDQSHQVCGLNLVPQEGDKKLNSQAFSLSFHRLPVHGSGNFVTHTTLPSHPASDSWGVSSRGRQGRAPQLILQHPAPQRERLAGPVLEDKKRRRGSPKNARVPGRDCGNQRETNRKTSSKGWLQEILLENSVFRVFGGHFL